MLIRRCLHTKFFSRKPLTYEKLKQRADQLNHSGDISAPLIEEYIYANRQLQHLNEHNKTIHNTATSTTNFLNLKSVDNLVLENDLWNFLRSNWKLCVNNSGIVKAYLLRGDDLDMGRAFDIIRSSFEKNLDMRTPVLIMLHWLLKKNDYENAIQLLDITLNSTHALHRREREYNSGLRICSILSAFTGFLQFLVCPLSLFHVAFPVTTVAIFGTYFGFLRCTCGDVGNRVQWRPYTSLRHRFIHYDEQRFLNKIVTQFEETCEVNFKNYHISEVRSTRSLGIFEHGSSQFFLPSISTLPMVKNANTEDERLNNIANFIKTQINSRKLLWGHLKEEERLIDFWCNHGEGYEWVEPDQDPAEISTFHEKT